MASNKLRGTDSDGIKSLLDSVLGSDSEESDLSGAESDDVQACSVSEDESSDDRSVQSGDNADAEPVPVPAKRTKRVTRTDSDWKWTKNDNTPIIYPFSENSGVCQQLSSKYDSESPSELAIFLEYMDPLFSVISKETNDYADEQLQNPTRKKKKTR
jgi:hypothetical protein